MKRRPDIQTIVLYVVFAAPLVLATALFLLITPSNQATGAGSRFELNTKVVQGDEVVISDMVITDLSSATTLTVPTGARWAKIQAQGGNIRYRWGTAPDATTGGIIYAGSYFNVYASPTTIQIIEETSADAYVAFIR